MRDLKYLKNGTHDLVNDALGLKQKTTISFTFKNSTYTRTDTTFIDDLIYSIVTDSIGIGPYPYYEDVPMLKKKGFRAILNLQTTENMVTLGINPSAYEDVCQRNQIKYVNIPIIDQVDLDPKKCLDSVEKLKHLIDEHDRVYVHCSEGVNRSPTVVIIYLHIYQ
jgi:protein tyrosine phosphatase (PTP) superfamily phosphohydrolase (DUF442 family)